MVIVVINQIFDQKLMGRKGKNKREEEEEQPNKKKHMISEEELMDKSHMDRTIFIPILISQSLYQPFIINQHSQQAIQKILTDLNYLLFLQFKQFWATILYNPTLKNCLATALSFLHRKWLNSYLSPKNDQEQQKNNMDEENEAYQKIKSQQFYEHTQALAEVLLKIYYRIVSFKSQDKNLSDLYKISQQISKKYILDMAKLFQLIEIYGQSNSSIVKHIIKMYSHTVQHFYHMLTTEILPIIIKRMDILLRSFKTLTERQQFGINYSYKKMHGKQLSPGQEELKRKINMLLELLSFHQIITAIRNFFPQDCANHCYFNSNLHFIYQNIFLELQAAYKIWNYQSQQLRILPIINFILYGCISYFISYFNQCNNIFVLRQKNNAVEAYLNSLMRMFKEYGKRNSISKKANIKRNMLMYKIIQKQFDLNQMLHNIYMDQIQNQTFEFNIEYLIDFKIALETQLKEQEKQKQRLELKEQEKQRQRLEEKERENINIKASDSSTINLKDQEDSIKNQQNQLNDKQTTGDQSMNHLKSNKSTKKSQQQMQNNTKNDLSALEVLVPKRQRGDDYYTKLYKKYQNNFKVQYEDEYDDLVDYDRRPMNYNDGNKSDEDNQSESDQERHLVSNPQNLKHVKDLHSKHTINRDALRNQRNQQEKYHRVQGVDTHKLTYKPGNRQTNQLNKDNYQSDDDEPDCRRPKQPYYKPNQESDLPKKQYIQKKPQEKPKYVSKVPPERIEEEVTNKNNEEVNQAEGQQQRGGQGHKKNNKSYNYVNKNDKKDNYEKGKNSNKAKDYGEGGARKYKEKY